MTTDPTYLLGIPHVEPYIELKFHLVNNFKDLNKSVNRVQEIERLNKGGNRENWDLGVFDGVLIEIILFVEHILSHRLSLAFKVLDLLSKDPHTIEISKNLRQVEATIDYDEIFWLTKNNENLDINLNEEISLILRQLQFAEELSLDIIRTHWQGTSTLEEIEEKMIVLSEYLEQQSLPNLEVLYHKILFINETKRQPDYEKSFKEIEEIISRLLQPQESDIIREAIFARRYNFWEVVTVGVDLCGTSEDFQKISKDKIPDWWE